MIEGQTVRDKIKERPLPLDEALDIFLSPDIDETVNRFIFSGGFNWSIGESLLARFTTGVDYRANSQTILEPIGFTELGQWIIEQYKGSRGS